MTQHTPRRDPSGIQVEEDDRRLKCVGRARGFEATSWWSDRGGDDDDEAKADLSKRDP